MDKIRIQEIAEEAGIPNSDLLLCARKLGINIKASNSAICMEEAGILIDYVISGTLPKNWRKNQKKESKIVDNKNITIDSSPRKTRWNGITIIGKSKKSTQPKTKLLHKNKENSQKTVSVPATFKKKKKEKKSKLDSSLKILIESIENSRMGNNLHNDMKDFLKYHGIQSLWHFTDRSNLESIQKYGILSLKKIEKQRINIQHTGADTLSHSLDYYRGWDKYVHLAFISDHPMYHVAKSRGSIIDPIWIEIDISVIFEESTIFFNKVANDSTAKPFKLEKLKKKIDFDKMFHYDFDIKKEARKAEILVKGVINPDKIIGVYNGK